VLNSLAGEFVAASFAVTAVNGRFIEIGKRGIWTAEQARQLGKNISYHVLDLGEVAKAQPEKIGRLLAETMEAAERGQWKPLPFEVFPFCDAIQAYRHMAQAQHTGKIVLRQEFREVRISPEATYLIAGGFGGLGLELGRWLVEKGARNLVLTGRREPSAAARERIAALEAQGARVVTRRADVALRDEMAAVVREIETRMPPLRGVIHAAGVLDDGVLAEQSWPRFERVLAPKVAGAWILHELTARMPLDFFVLFSSAASVLGSPGQSNHAAANAFEDALAHFRRRQGLPAISINWGAWSEQGAAAREELETRRRTLGLGSLTTEEGLAIFEQVLAANPTQVAAVPVDWQRFAGHYPANALPSWLRGLERRKDSAAPDRKADDDLLEQLRGAPENNRPAILRAYVQELACRVLGFTPGRHIEPLQPLNELGLDSLMAVEFRNALAAAVNRPLPATLLFSYPAIEDITNYLAGELYGKPASVAAAPAGTTLERIEDLSDEDV